jgi:hypothetical protein
MLLKELLFYESRVEKSMMIEPPETTMVEPGLPTRETGLSMINDYTSIYSSGRSILSPLFE